MARRTRSERFATPRRMYLCAASLAPGFAGEAALHGRLGGPLSADQGETEAKERTDPVRPARRDSLRSPAGQAGSPGSHFPDSTRGARRIG